jgi:hypothetical protein
MTTYYEWIMWSEVRQQRYKNVSYIKNKLGYSFSNLLMLYNKHPTLDQIDIVVDPEDPSNLYRLGIMKWLALRISQCVMDSMHVVQTLMKTKEESIEINLNKKSFTQLGNR